MLEGLARKNRRIYIKIKEKDRLIGRACNRKHLNKSSKKKKKNHKQIRNNFTGEINIR